MSTGRLFRHDFALLYARHIVAALEPVTKRTVIAGSLRRGKAEVSDIEIVVEPSDVTVDLLGNLGPDIPPIHSALRSRGRMTKRGNRYVRVESASSGNAELMLPYGMAIDCFIVWAPAEWGTILAIRTGPAKLGQHAVTCMYRYGRRCVDGHVIDVHTGQVYPTPDEESFFRAAGLRCLPPGQRDSRAAYVTEVPA